ncbi:hypothetical protein CEXT_32911 [Caerostris extrusa]|uniref:Uncharacterized protein n=1 Tax=Caerostris extrusa TaxID=172846 RepID=A0AAV4PG19_CAEEX|nr:hypothetical protein CEXT_32911 [Caerostris extrusa]
MVSESTKAAKPVGTWVPPSPPILFQLLITLSVTSSHQIICFETSSFTPNKQGLIQLAKSKRIRNASTVVFLSFHILNCSHNKILNGIRELKSRKTHGELVHLSPPPLFQLLINSPFPPNNLLCSNIIHRPMIFASQHFQSAALLTECTVRKS